jgi:alpha-L-arabinofuranosidase
VRKAMESGQFVFCRSTRNIDYNPIRFTGFDIFPTIKSIDVDSEAGTITIEADDYDEIKWISAPQSLETLEDYEKSNKPWQLGTIVHTGKTLDYKNVAGIKNYVRAELHRKDGEHIQRTFTNPFGFAAS